MRRNLRRCFSVVILVAVIAALAPPLSTPVAATETTTGPSNDDFADAVVLDAPATWEGDTTGSTSESGEPKASCAKESGTGTVWFRFTPRIKAAQAIARVTVTTRTADIVVATYGGDELTALSEVDCTDGPAAGTEHAAFVIARNQTYSVAVTGNTRADFGEYQLSLEFGDLPSNDDFVDSTAVSLGSRTPGTTIGATAETGEPTHGCSGGDESVWFHFTAETDATIRVQASTPRANQVVAIYTGDQLASLTPVACAPTWDGGVESPVVAGQRYFVAVVARDKPRDFTLTLNRPPENDDIDRATELVVPSAFGDSTKLSTVEAGEAKPPCVDTPVGSIWYRYTPLADGVLITDIKSSARNYAAVYEGSRHGDLLLAACDGSDGSQVRVHAGRTYSIAVVAAYPAGSFTADFSLLADAAANDDFDAAQPFSFVESENGFEPVTVSGDTRKASLEAGEASCSGKPGGGSVWYAMTTPPAPQGDGLVRFSLSSWFSRVSVFTADAAGKLHEAGCGQELPVKPATTYYVSVAAASAYYDGPFTLTASFATSPGNDDFEDAEGLSLPDASVGTTRDSSRQLHEPSCGPWRRSVWYRIDPPDGHATVTLTHAGVLTLGVYVGDGAHNFETLTQIACMTTPLTGSPTATTVPVAGDRPYYLQVLSHSESGEDFAIAVDVAKAEGPGNDDFEDAQRIADGEAASGTTLGATVESGENIGVDCARVGWYDNDRPQRSGTVWYEFTPQQDGVARLRLTSAADLGFAVFEGSSLDELRQTACRSRRPQGMDEVRDMNVAAGTTYRVMVRDTGVTSHDPHAGGNFTLTFTSLALPANDDFAAAQTPAFALDGNTSVAGDTGGATLEVGEPLHACSDTISVSIDISDPDFDFDFGSEQPAYGHSVWYRFDAPGDGIASVTLSGESDQAVGVYYGDSLDGLRGVPCIDAAGLEHDAYTANIAAGRTYYIAVLARDVEETGRFALDFRFVPRDGPANDDFANAAELAAGTNTGDMTGATTEPDESTDCQEADRPSGTIWFKFTAPANSDGFARLRLTSQPLSILSVYRGSSLSELELVECLRPFVEDDVALKANAGETYYASMSPMSPLVDEAGGPVTIDYSFFEYPENDAAEHAETLEIAATGASSGSASGDTRGATPDAAGPPSCLDGAATVWYRFTAPEDGVARFAVKSAGGIGFALLRQVPNAEADELECVDYATVRATDTSVDEPGSARASVQLDGGAQYLLVVGARNRHDDGAFVLDWAYSPAPANDDFASARAVSTHDVLGSHVAVEAGDLAGATSELGETHCSSSIGRGTVWYRYTPPANGTLDLVLLDGDRLSLALYTGEALADLRTRACTGGVMTASAELHGPASFSLRLNADGKPVIAQSVRQGVTYWIAVAGASRPDPSAFEIGLVFAAGEPLASVTVNDPSAAEGDELAGNDSSAAVFTVALSNPAPSAVSVSYSTEGGQATPAVDFEPQSGTITFQPGDISKQIRVPVTADSLDEPDETFFLLLYDPDGVVIEDEFGVGTINDDDEPVRVSVADTSVLEGRHKMVTPMAFEVSLSTASGHVVRIPWETFDETAKAGADYVSMSGTVEFAPGETSKTVTVMVLGDNIDESNETLTLLLGQPKNAELLDAAAIGRIVDDDPRP